MSRRLLTFLAGVLLLAGAGYLATSREQTGDEVVVRSASGEDVLPVEEFCALDANPHAPESSVSLDMASLAAIAANVYEKKGSEAASCTDEGRINLPGWGELDLGHLPQGCNALQSGLHYEIWGKLDLEREYGYVVVVFRGTVPRLVAHWCSNLRDASLPFCDPESDQYLAIAPLIDRVLELLRAELGWDFYSVAVGHSLGGGLAELAARSSYIDQAIVFDPSPVTAREISDALATPDDSMYLEDLQEQYDGSGCDLELSNPIENEHLRIHRVYEHGEALAPLRWVKRLLSGLSPGVTEYRTNMLGGGAVAQHGMKALACSLLHARGGATGSRTGSDGT